MCDSYLSKVKDIRRVYVTPDLNEEERDKRRKLKEDFIAKIKEQRWVIRHGAVS